MSKDTLILRKIAILNACGQIHKFKQARKYNIKMSSQPLVSVFFLQQINLCEN